jgi:hypothetical protein
MVALKLDAAFLCGTAAGEFLFELRGYLAHVDVVRIEPFDDGDLLAVPAFLDAYVDALGLLGDVLTDTEVLGESTGRTDLRHATPPLGVSGTQSSNRRREGLGFACRLHQHDDVALSDGTDGVSGEYAPLVGAFEDTRFDLHSLAVHTRLADHLYYLRRRRFVTLVSALFRF